VSTFEVGNEAQLSSRLFKTEDENRDMLPILSSKQLGTSQSVNVRVESGGSIYLFMEKTESSDLADDHACRCLSSEEDISLGGGETRLRPIGNLRSGNYSYVIFNSSPCHKRYLILLREVHFFQYFMQLQKGEKCIGK
jgi:hypothetical protein